MGCGSCSSGACGSSGGTPAGCENNGNCSSGGCGKLEVFDWLAGMESSAVNSTPLIEVRFKNTRKEYFRYGTSITPSVGDIVMVEAAHGTDVGAVTLTGELVKVQLTRKNSKTNVNTLSRVIRIATQQDIDLWQEVQKKENDTMVSARKSASDLKLDMKISDVEYQGDGTKAIFYYTSESRVDFRELIKKFAGTYKVRVEMKQIGARQEAGRVGGIGSCGRELCCSTWLTDFRSVSTSAARYQQLAINPIKLAGQCGKLKCCLNYELDSYLDALKEFPEGDIKLKTKKGIAFLQKTDIFRKTLWFNSKDDPSVFHPLKLETVKEILEMNKNNKFPESLKQFAYSDAPIEDLPDYENVVGQDDLNRFNNKDKKKNNNRNRNKRKGNKPQGQGKPQQNDQNNNKQGQGGNQQGQKKTNSNQKRKPNGQSNPQNKNSGNRQPQANSKSKPE